MNVHDCRYWRSVFCPERRRTADDIGKRPRAWRKRCLGCELAFPGQRAFQRLSAAASGRLHSKARIKCRLAGRTLHHKAHEGSLAICPAGLDTSAEADQDLNALLVAVRPDKFALAAAEDGTLEAQLIGRLCGHDQTLLDLAGVLARESREGYPHGTVFWNETAGQFIDNLAIRHAMGTKAKPNGPLTTDILKRLKEFVFEHLDEPLDVATLAKMTNRSQFHFSRAFTRSVGVSPYRYVVHLRLQRAVELVRDGKFGLAEIAAKTGFADQSHLTRWVRRVHGVSLTQIMTRS